MRLPFTPLALLTLTACGNGLVTEDFQGEAIDTIALRVAEEGEPTDGPLRAAYFWLPDTARARDLDAWVEDRPTSRAVTRPQDIQLALFDAPAPGPYGVAFGTIFVYADTNEDGQRQASEAIVGQLHEHILAFSPNALDAAKSPTGRALPAGLSALTGRLPCGLLHGKPVCDVPIGRACAGPSVCEGGLCLLPGPDETFAGVCVAPAECAADDAVLAVDLPPRDGLPGRYLQAPCNGEPGCQQGTCDALTGRCVADPGLTVSFRGTTRGPLVCDDPAEPPRGFLCGLADQCQSRTQCRYFVNMGAAYLSCGQRRTWADAQAFCESFGGTLAIMDGVQEEDALIDAGIDGWIGLSDIAEEGVYTWVDGAPMTYQNWDLGVPFGHLQRDEDCVALKGHPKRGWRLDPCEDQKSFICEAKL